MTQTLNTIAPEEPGGSQAEIDRWRRHPESAPLKHGVLEIRSKIHALLGRFEENRLATRASIHQFREAAEADQNLEGLGAFHQWITEKWFEAHSAMKEVERGLEQAVLDENISEEDRASLMENLVLTDRYDFVSPVVQGQIAESLLSILEESKKGREEYEGLLENPLVSDGILVTAKGEIEVPDLETFSKMPMGERQLLLLQIRKALAEAETHQGQEEKRESFRLDQEFGQALFEKRREGILGFGAIQRFMALFRKADNETKAATLEGLEEILEPYAALWEEIRETLQGAPLRRLEGLREMLNHVELRAQFERVCAQEELRLEWAYAQRLDRAHSEKILPARERKEWMSTMRKEGLEGKREKLETFEEELEPYHELRAEIDALDNHDFARELDAMALDGSAGLEEIRARLETLGEGGAETEEGAQDPRVAGILANIRRKQVREAIVEAQEELGGTAREKLARRLTHYLDGRRSNYNEDKTFEDHVENAWVEHQKAYVVESNILADDEEQDLLSQNRLSEEEFDEDDLEGVLGDEFEEIALPAETEKGTLSEEGAAGAKILRVRKLRHEANTEETFEKIEGRDLEDKEDENTVIKMEIADEEAVQNLNNENTFFDPKKVSLCFMTGGEKDDVELNRREMESFEEILRLGVEQEQGQAA